MKNMSEQIQAIIKKQCEVVGADPHSIDFKSNDWFLKYEWTEKQEADFIKWLTEHLKDKKTMLQLSQITSTKLSFRKKIANAWVFNYGWKMA